MAETLQGKLLLEELISIEDILGRFLDTDNLWASELDDADLDRAEARKQDMMAAQTALTEQNDVLQGAVNGEIHEEHRIRRDVKIARASHKRLMLSCLSTLASRRNDLLANELVYQD